MTAWPIRDAEPADLPVLARLWHDGWQDGHAGIVPDDLKAIRTLADFQARLPGHLAHARTAGPAGAPVALCITDGNELYQFYVAAEARGTGLAAALLADGEARIAAAGHATARLDVADGNARATRFYAKNGWQAQGLVDVDLHTTSGPFRLTVLRMTKPLAP